MAGKRFKALVGLTIAGALLASSSVATAAGSAPAPQISPWATLTMLSGGASAAAVCGAAAASAAAQPMSGCVLPVLDAPPPPPVASASAAPVAVPAMVPPAAGFGMTPILLGLVAIAAAAGFFFAVKNNGHGNGQPNSPG